MLLRRKASVDMQDKQGLTALMRASRAGCIDAMKLLLQHGAQVDAIQAVHGGTALTHAAWEGQLESIKLLLMAGRRTQ